MSVSYFNMEDPVVGGYTPEKVALRRAIELAYDIGREIHIVRRGQAIAAQAPMPPGTSGYDPALRTENSVHDPARAKALLDIYGYLDRNGDGWREMPDGRPLLLEMATQARRSNASTTRSGRRAWRRPACRSASRRAQWSENLKAARAGKLRCGPSARTASTPDAQLAFDYMYGPSIGRENLARFKLPAFDSLYRRISALPDGPERHALFVQASDLITAYMPYRSTSIGSTPTSTSPG